MTEHVSFMVDCKCGRGKYNPRMCDMCAYCEFDWDEEHAPEKGMTAAEIEEYEARVTRFDFPYARA